ncbi:MAG: hypothetical protein KGY74_04555 [Candidatus Cloacimonetes bacterium]|nr:hypothetical protein [Candidatus Cloacimonadota bacterium]
MRKKKWLLIVILIILLINALLIFIPKIFNVNQIVEDRLKSEVNKYLDAELFFDKINVTSKFIQFSNPKLIEKENNFSISAEQFYIRFNFWKLIFTGFNFQSSIEKIRCFSPVVELKLSPSEEGTSLDLQNIENQLQRFSQISIINGEFELESKNNHLRFKEKLENINITFTFDKNKYNLEFTAYKPDNKGFIKITRHYYEDKENLSELSLQNFHLPNVKTPTLEIKDGKVESDIKIRSEKKIDGEFSLNNLDLLLANNNIHSDSIRLQINKNTGYFLENSKLNWDNISLTLSGKIKDVVSYSPYIDTDFHSNPIQLNKFFEPISGKLTLKGNIAQSISDLRIKHQFEIPELVYQNLEFNNINYSGIYSAQKIDSITSSFQFRDNTFLLAGLINLNTNQPENSNLNLNFSSSQPLEFSQWNIKSENKLQSEITGTPTSPIVKANLKNMTYDSKLWNIQNFNFAGNFRDNSVLASLQNKNNSININLKSDNISDKIFNLELNTKNLRIEKLFKKSPFVVKKNIPVINSNLNLSHSDNMINLEGQVSFPKKTNSNLSGTIDIAANYNLISQQNAKITLNSENLKIKNDSLPLKFILSKTKETIFIDTFQINQKINGNGKLAFSKNFEDLKNYSGNLRIDRIKLDFLEHFLNFPQDLQNVSGLFISELNFDSMQENNIEGFVKLDSVATSKKLDQLSAETDFSLRADKLLLKNIRIRRKNNLFFKGNGSYAFYGSNNIYLKGSGENIITEEILPNDILQANLSYELIFTGNPKDPRLLCKANLTNGRILETNFDNLDIHFFQNSKNIFVKNFKFLAKNKLDLSILGQYSYNFFKDEYYQKPDSLLISGSGNLLSAASDYISSISNCSGEGDFNFVITSQNEGVTFRSGYLNLRNGSCRIENQPERIEEINIDLTLNNNKVDKFNSSLEIGVGKLNVTNQINNADTDLILGGVNFGTLLLETPGKGLLIHVPTYSSEGSLVEARLMGREDKYFRILNRDDFILLQGKIFLTNGKAIYDKKDKKEKEEPAEERFNPFAYDVDIAFGKNIWFVTDPFYLRVDKNDYIRLMLIPELEESSVSFELHSHQGNMRLFGETFTVREVTFTKSETDPKLFINGIFEKKTASGSIITLKLSPVSEDADGRNIGGESYGDVQISLESDDPNDATMLSVLSKLHYGKSYSQLTSEEKQDFDQSEIINLASDQLGKMIISPVISPIESTFRRWLGLDYFRLQTDWLENFARSSGISSSEEDDFFYDPDQSQIIRYGLLGRDVLLDNLSVDMGKYITPNWYVNYAAKVQKELTLERDVNYNLEHQITFRYDLPWHLRLIYLYRFSPIEEEYIQRLSLKAYVNF